MNDVLFFAYSNSRENYLPTLGAEDDEISQLLTPNELKQHYILYRDSYATLDRLNTFLNLYRRHLVWFHYSGHAERDKLILGEADVRSEGILQLLTRCPRLKGVFLNGCSTREQVEALRAAGVPVVIGTSAPVEDFKAKKFAVSFYRSLVNGESVETAFEMALGEPLGESPIEVYRGIRLEEKTQEAPLWCLLHHEEKDERRWELPKVPVLAKPVEFTPNEILIDALYQSLEEYSEEVEELHEREAKGKTVTLKKKRMKILNSLPAPVAEHLRKLMVPSPGEDEGYDKITEVRLHQIVRTYNILMELLVYTLLAQLWELKYEKDKESEKLPEDEVAELVIPEDIRRQIHYFLQLSREERQTYEFIYLIRALRNVLDRNNVNYFVDELADTKKIFEEDNDFVEACFYLELMKNKVVSQEIPRQNVSEYCLRAEESLGGLFKELSFLAKYTLATVKNIDVLKYRHEKEAQFKHIVVMLNDLLGGMEEEDVTMERFMDARSVLLLKKQDEKVIDYLTISPFIIDENAFISKSTDISKVHFFSHYEQGADAYLFQYVFKPEDPFLTINGGSHDLKIIKAQFEAFNEIILHQNRLTA